jgi:hypothetical protein
MVLLLIALLFWVNYNLVLKLRPVDFLLMLFLLLTLPSIRMKYSSSMVLSVVFFIFYLLSTIYGILAIGVIAPNNFLFIYKYAIVFLLFCVLMNIDMHPQRVERLRVAIFLSYFLLIAYAFLYLPLRLRGLVEGGIRVTFPFSNDVTNMNGLSDAPLYSVVLSTFLVGYLFYPGNGGRRERIRKTLVAISTVAAIIMSGSRTGILSLPITFGVYLWKRSMPSFLRGLTQFRRRTLAAGVLLIFLALIFMVSFSRLIGGGSDPTRSDFRESDLSMNIGRALSFGADDSVNGRVIKTTGVFDTVLSGLIVFGVGMQSATNTWIDNGYAAVILAAGFGGLLSILLAIYFFLRASRVDAMRNATMPYYEGLELLFVNYLVCCFTSEYFLVTRGLVPFAILAALYSYRIRNGSMTNGSPGALSKLRG